MLKILIHIFKSMIYIYQNKKITFVPMKILLQDQGPQIIKNKRRRGHKSFLRGITRAVVYGMVFLSADDAFSLDGCIGLIHLIQKVGCHHKPR